MARNVLGEALAECSRDPLTGFYRDGCCRTDRYDPGRHVVCARMTEAFLDFTRAQGNDLSSPAPDFAFPGLRPGDRWCLSVLRWKEAVEAGVGPPVYLAATDEQALKYVSLADLLYHAADAPGQGP